MPGAAPASPRPPRVRSRRAALPATALAVGALVLGGCGQDTAAPGSDDATSGEAGSARLQVATSFYALQYAAERIGGELVEVTSLTPPGVDPHDVELSPRQVRELGQADAVVVLSGFQPPVDEAVEARAPEHLLDVRDAVRLLPPDAETDPTGHDDHEDGHDHDHDHDHGDLAGLDPHFWLDPSRMIDTGFAVADLLAEAAPEHADEFARGAAELETELTSLDREYRNGLATCDRDVVVTGHGAFGYLARTYGFTEIGIAGIDPDNEPSPARLREIRAVLEQHDVTTIYTNSGGDASVAAALAEALEADVMVLDPIEVQHDVGKDYVDVMRANLDALRTGLGCR